MTESEWLRCTDPKQMLEFLHGKVSDRKLRLFAVACFRWRSLPDPIDKIISIGELHADGLASLTELKEAQVLALTGQGVYQASLVVVSNDLFRTLIPVFSHEFWLWPERLEKNLTLLRDIFGNPFRPSPSLPPAVIAWNDRIIPRIAEGIYQERRMPEGTLDNGRLALIHDALLDADCDNEELLTHLRSEGAHVRGCWAIDLILGKE